MKGRRLRKPYPDGEGVSDDAIRRRVIHGAKGILVGRFADIQGALAGNLVSLPDRQSAVASDSTCPPRNERIQACGADGGRGLRVRSCRARENAGAHYGGLETLTVQARYGKVVPTLDCARINVHGRVEELRRAPHVSLRKERHVGARQLRRRAVKEAERLEGG